MIVDFQFQVMLESAEIVKVVLVLVPLGGTEPVPVQPVQVQTVLSSVTGLEMRQVTNEPEV